MKMDLIDTQELKAKLDRGDDFKFVMTLGEWEYRTTHIPGSMRISTIQEALEKLDPGDEIVLYDSGPGCPAYRRRRRVTELLCRSGRMRERRQPSWWSVSRRSDGKAVNCSRKGSTR